MPVFIWNYTFIINWSEVVQSQPSFRLCFCLYEMAGKHCTVSKVLMEQQSGSESNAKQGWGSVWETQSCLAFHAAKTVTYSMLNNAFYPRISKQRPLQTFKLEIISYHFSPPRQGFH